MLLLALFVFSYLCFGPSIVVLSKNHLHWVIFNLVLKKTLSSHLLVVLLLVLFILTHLILELGFSNNQKCSLPRHILEDHPLSPYPSWVPLQHGFHRGKEIKTYQHLGFINGQWWGQVNFLELLLISSILGYLTNYFVMPFL